MESQQLTFKRNVEIWAVYFVPVLITFILMLSLGIYYWLKHNQLHSELNSQYIPQNLTLINSTRA